MNKKELDEFLKQNQYLNQLKEDNEAAISNLFRNQQLTNNEQNKNLEKALIELIDEQKGKQFSDDKQTLSACLKLMQAVVPTNDSSKRKQSEEELQKLIDLWMGWQSGSGLRGDAAWDKSVPKDIQNELNSALGNNACNDIRTMHGYYRITANEDGSNTLYVDSRWLKKDYIKDISTPQDYLTDIKKIIGNNEDIKISDMKGEFKNESVKDFFYKADVDYGVQAERDTPRLTR